MARLCLLQSPSENTRAHCSRAGTSQAMELWVKSFVVRSSQITGDMRVAHASAFTQITRRSTPEVFETSS